MLNFILAVATALFGSGRIRQPHVPWQQPYAPDGQRRLRGLDDTLAKARRALDGVDHPLIL